MTRFQSPTGLNASLDRRVVLIGASALALSACGKERIITVSRTPPLDTKLLNRDIGAIAAKARPGRLGVGLMNLESGESWSRGTARLYPLQSVFKMLLGAAALAEVDAGRLRLDEVIELTGQTLSPPWSPIADAYPARRDYTVEELLTAAVSISDNTAADLLMRRIGGPGALTAWLANKRLPELRVDRYERELQPESVGLASFREAWKGETAYTAAMLSVDPALRRTAMQGYLRDPRDTATPRGMLDFLKVLQAGELISPVSTQRLIGLMTQTARGADRLKAALPRGASLAHKPGTGRFDQGVNAAVNDVGLMTLDDGRVYAICAFLTGSALDAKAADAVIADVGQVMVEAIG